MAALAGVAGLCRLTGAGLGAEPGPRPWPSSPPEREAHFEAPPAGHTGGFGEPTCRACHDDGPLDAPPGTLEVRGLEAPLLAGETRIVTITLWSPDMTSAGFQAAVRWAEGARSGAQAGRLEAAGGAVAVLVDSASAVQYAHHTAGGTGVADGTARWRFRWVVPERAGPVVLHVAANSANGDNSPLGDLIYARTERAETMVGAGVPPAVAHAWTGGPGSRGTLAGSVVGSSVPIERLGAPETEQASAPDLVQLLPALDVELDGGQGGGRHLFAHAREQRDEGGDAGIVTDDHDALGIAGQLGQDFEVGVGRGEVEVAGALDFNPPIELARGQLGRREGADRRRAEDAVGDQVLLHDELPHAGGVAGTPRVEGTIMIPQAGIVPRGFGVPEDEQRLHVSVQPLRAHRASRARGARVQYAA